MQERLPQPLDGKIIVLDVLGPHETNGTPNRGMANRLIELPFCTQAQIRQDARDQVFNAVATAEHLGACECAARKIRLQPLDQPSFVLSPRIMLDPLRPTQTFALPAS